MAVLITLNCMPSGPNHQSLHLTFFLCEQVIEPFPAISALVEIVDEND
jgi:hypothetical protein